MMNNKNVLLKNEHEANKFAAKMLLGTAILILVAMTLVLVGAFGNESSNKASQVVNYSTAAVVALVPAMILLVFKLQGYWIKYMMVFSAALSIGILNYMVSTPPNHSLTTVWLFTVAVASLYFSRKLSIFALVLMIGIMTASDVVIKNSSLISSVLARTMENGPLILVFITLSGRTKKLLMSMMKSEEEQTRIIENTMALVNKSSDVSAVLAESVSQLSEITNMTTKASEQVASHASQVATGSEVTMNQVNEALAAVKAISENLNKIAGESSFIARISAETYENNKSSGVLIKDAVNEMKAVEKTTLHSRDIIHELGERSNEIGEIVEVITGIATQTNLLSLNAAIESARAGEHGKGFAVVSEEIRKLAEQSESAAKNISNIIKKVLEDTTKAVETMENGARLVAKGLHFIEQAGDAFEKSSVSGVEVNGRIQDVSSVTQNISIHGDKIVDVIENIKTISEKSISELQNIAAASQEQLASMEQVTTSVKTIEEMAQELKKAVLEK
ncbi:MAG: methyl-accepting chemotaxis protein [Clostridia bacterium]|nr:methyl-accepting chemotaxis protein [Clostridia bacterium]